MDERNISYKSFIRHIQPAYLLVGFIMYGLGTAIASYLGDFIQWDLYWMGQGYVFTIQLSTYLLLAYFNRGSIAESELEGEDVNAISRHRFTRKIYIQIGLFVLAVSAVFISLLFISDAITTRSVLFLVLVAVFGLGLAVPPFQIANKGYGELLHAIMVANFFPVIAFLLQADSFHRLLGLLSFPLTLLFLAMLLVYSLPTFASDIKYERATLMVKVGWRLGMTLHNALLLAGFLMITSLSIFGLPWRILWPGLLALPVGLFQIVQIERIANGRKPNWTMMKTVSFGTVAIAAYLLTFTLWMD